MKISVVIPCYNGRKFLAEAVDSINNQTYRPIEIVVVDDGSTDNPSELLKELETFSSVPIVTVRQRNYGVSAARNIGLANAKGDWIAFLDVDDIWFPNMLEVKVKALMDYGMSSGLICSNYFEDKQSPENDKHGKSSLVKSVQDRRVPGRDFQKYFVRENFIGTATVMMFSRQEALRVGGFDCFMKHSEDFDFILRLSCLCDVLVLSEPLALKRHHGNNLTDDKELYYYSHFLSCLKNGAYKREYCRESFGVEILASLRCEADKFLTGYCNQVYERNIAEGFKCFFVSFLTISTFNGLCLHFVALVKKLVRTASFGIIRRRQRLP